MTPTADKITIDSSPTHSITLSEKANHAALMESLRLISYLIEIHQFKVYIASSKKVWSGDPFQLTGKNQKLLVSIKKGIRRSVATTAQFPVCPFQAK